VNRNNQNAPNLTQVRDFWEANPLCALESSFPVGSKEFFAWHDRIRSNDVEAFAIHLYEFDNHEGDKVLDLGCGIGWLCQHFAAQGADVIGVDLTGQGVALTRQRLDLAGLQSTLIQASAEQLPFQADSFDFVTCAGVLHHTPDTLRGIREIYRILRPGGRAMINLYYKNWLLSEHLWPFTRLLVRTLFGSLPGRSAFRQVNTVDDFVRIYDGNDNPIGKSYSRNQVIKLFSDFTIENLEVHYFPRRFLPLGRFLSPQLHRLLDHYCGMMIYGTLHKGE
jgi:ubiquinone/menaquinone biosynthesis C-methylase UbiE